MVFTDDQFFNLTEEAQEDESFPLFLVSPDAIEFIKFSLWQFDENLELKPPDEDDKMVQLQTADEEGKGRSLTIFRNTTENLNKMHAYAVEAQLTVEGCPTVTIIKSLNVKVNLDCKDYYFVSKNIESDKLVVEE